MMSLSPIANHRWHSRHKVMQIFFSSQVETFLTCMDVDLHQFTSLVHVMFDVNELSLSHLG